MLITFVIWANNCDAVLEQNLEKIFSIENLRLFEVVLIEDASDDKTGEIATHFLHKYPDNMQIIYCRTNMGISNAYRCGIELARGDYLYFLSSDSYICSLKNLELFTAFLTKKNYPDIVETPVKYVWANRASKCRLQKTSYGPIAKNPELLANVHPLLFTKFVKLELLKNHNISFNRFHFYPGYVLYMSLLNAETTAVFKKTIFALQSFDTGSYSNLDLFRQWKLIHRDFGKITMSADFKAALEYAYVKFALYYFFYIIRQIQNSFFIKKAFSQIEKSLPNLKEILKNNVYFQTPNEINKYLVNFVFKMKYLKVLPK